MEPTGRFDAVKQWLEDRIPDWIVPKLSSARVLVGVPVIEKDAKGQPLIRIDPIYARDAGAEHDPASTTKLMTFYLWCKHGKQGLVDVDASTMDYNKYGPRAKDRNRDFYKPGQSILIDEAVKAMMGASDNITAAAIAESIGKGKTPRERHHDFVRLMNETAKSIGMADTRFINANGMPLVADRDGTDTKPAMTSARDMAVLITRVYHDYPELAARYLELGELKSNGTVRQPVSHLNDPKSASYVKRDPALLSVGNKTGYTLRAGFNMVSKARDENGNELVVVFLGVPNVDIERAVEIVGEQAKKLAAGAKKDHVKGGPFNDAVTAEIIKAWRKAVKEGAVNMKMFPALVAPAATAPLPALDVSSITKLEVEALTLDELPSAPQPLPPAPTLAPARQEVAP